jgi:hypothetical protein
VLAGGAALAVLGVGVSACGQSPPKAPTAEDLLGPRDQAWHDSTLAAAAATALGLAPQVAAALSVVATQRAAHARALSTEISRVANKPISSTSETPSPSPAVIDALRASAESATRLVATSAGYRSGLLASIAASCTASYTVALVPGGPSI